MNSNIAPSGMVVTPHHLATQTAIEILRAGGTAVEAIVAAAATMAVVNPNMNSIGGDSFWLIVPPNGEPIVIEACGTAGSLATDSFFSGLNRIPYKGPKAACTVAGTVGGWQEALKYVSECGYQRVSLHSLLADAIRYAEEGFSITKLQHSFLSNIDPSKTSSYFTRVFMPDGKVPNIGERFCQKELGNTLRHLVDNGLDSFYKGILAEKIAADLELLGTPITKSDLENYKVVRKNPLTLMHSLGELYNTPPPSQGVVSLALLGILDKLHIDGKNEGEFVHAVVEATKQVFKMRDSYVTDPRYMKVNPNWLLSSLHLWDMAKNIRLNDASTEACGDGEGDTIWMGAMDSKGFSVSFIQSIYHKYGSEVLLPGTGILWNNRGAAFSLDKNSILHIEPGKKPFHTLNPAAAKLNDGRVMIYGTQGGDGQPQTQAAIFHRYVVQELGLQTSVNAPRWLYGRQTGDPDTKLKLEGRFCKETVEYLKDRGHDIKILSDFSSFVGQSGALVRHPNGVMEGAFDLRSDGSAAGF